ncbi:ribonuclease P [Candidatus Woesearchaeota archaeon]|nr:ribonuclease P [Candidatus Woesearchaeota archaeon]
MAQKYPSKPREQQELAAKAVEKYFRAAERFFRDDKEIANNCVKEARKVAMKFKVRIPSKYKRRMCKKCLSYLVPGVNCRTRLKNKNVITYCFNCKNVMKVGYSENR